MLRGQSALAGEESVQKMIEGTKDCLTLVSKILETIDGAGFLARIWFWVLRPGERRRLLRQQDQLSRALALALHIEDQAKLHLE